MLNQRATTNTTEVAAGTTTTVGFDKNSVNWSIKIDAGTATSGTVTLTAKSAGASDAETVYDSFGAAIVFNAASSTPQTYYFSAKPVDFVVMTPSALDGTYTYSIGQW